jgi:hypothetical protein
MKRLEHFIDTRLTNGGEIVNLIHRLPLPPGRLLVLIFVKQSRSRTVVRLEGLGEIKITKTSSRIEPTTF